MAKTRLQIDVKDDIVVQLRVFKEKNGGSYGDVTERALKLFFRLHDESTNKNATVKLVDWDGTEREIYFL